MAEEKIWYAARPGDQEPLGPMALDELRELVRSGSVDDESLVWKAGMAEWTSPAAVPELTVPEVTIPTASAPTTPPPSRAPAGDTGSQFGAWGTSTGSFDSDEPSTGEGIPRGGSSAQVPSVDDLGAGPTRRLPTQPDGMAPPSSPPPSDPPPSGPAPEQSPPPQFAPPSDPSAPSHPSPPSGPDLPPPPAPVVREPASEAPSPAPPAPETTESPLAAPPAAEVPEPAVRIVSVDSRDVAYDGQVLSFAMQLGIVWVVASGVVMAAGSGLADLAESPGLAWSSLLLVAAVTVIALQFLTGGVARLVTCNLEGRSYRARDAWKFVLRRWLGLSLGNLGVLLGLLLATGLVAWLVTSLTRIPGVGELLGAVLILPTFFFFLVSSAVLLNSYLLPCIMGCENAGFLGAVRHLVSFSNKPTRMFQVFEEFYARLFSVVPLFLATSVVMAAALFSALRVCTSETFRRILSQEGSNFLANLLQFVSVGGILYAWLAFLVSYLIATFTMVYYNGSR